MLAACDESCHPRDVMPELRMSEALDFTPQLPEPSTVETPVGEVAQRLRAKRVVGAFPALDNDCMA